MARPMPPLVAEFAQQAAEAVALAKAGDIALASSPTGSVVKREWYVARVELLYEVAFLRLFTEWELFLERSFFRYLCGYVSTHGSPARSSGTYFGTLALAEHAVLGGRDFVLWHNPMAVVARARGFFVGSPHETVVASNTGRLVDLAAVRHRIAHAQEDARRKFDVATMNLAGQRYRGARPGRFLRDWNPVHVTKRWLEAVGDELHGLAAQIA